MAGFNNDLSQALSGLVECLSDDERKLILDNTIVQSFRKGEYIYEADEESVYLLCLLSGRVKLEKLGVGGRNQIMRMMRPYQYFGYRSYFAEQGHVTSAVAMEPSMLACTPMTIIEKLVQENGQFAMVFIRELASDLGQSDIRTVNLTQKHIRGRLADSILFLVDKYGMESDGCTINMYLSREDLAALSNMTTSNAIRTLSNFVSEGLISVDGRRIKVLDRDRLKHVNSCG